METTTLKRSSNIYLFFYILAGIFLLCSFFMGDIGDLIPGIFRIITSPTGLTVDFIAVGGVNAALLGISLLCIFFTLLLQLSGAVATATTIGAMFLTLGFGLFGKNILNVIPITVGVFLYSLYKKEPFAKYANFAMFGSALAPIASQPLWGTDLPVAAGIALFWVLGALAGFLVVPVSQYCSSLHKGFNLYNAGLSCGLIAFLFFSISKTFGYAPALNAIHSDGSNLAFPITFAVLFVAMVVVGFILNGSSFKGYIGLLKIPGQAPCDFLDQGFGLTLINMGLCGLLGMAYLLIIGGSFLGSSVGSLLSMVGFAAMGIHLRNVWPIFVGYGLASIFATWNLTDPALQIAVFFGCGLAPITGKWGIKGGIIAGFVHACIAVCTSAFHGGYNLYNGGFAAGLTAIILVPIFSAVFKEKKSAE